MSEKYEILFGNQSEKMEMQFAEMEKKNGIKKM